MTFGTPVSQEDATTLVHWALDKGINFFDTADMYEGYSRQPGSPGGIGESILGEALKTRRHDAVVTTKVGSDVGGKGLGRAHVLRQIEASLRRLQTDYVDIYEMHRPDADTPIVESIATMHELVHLGKIRHWGVSNFSAEQLRTMLEACDNGGFVRPVVSQPAYSWLNRDVESEHLPLCREMNLAVTPYQPFQGGLLAGKYNRTRPAPTRSRGAENGQWLRFDDGVFDRLEQFESEAAGAHLSPASYAVRWLLSDLAITSVVLGARSVEQLSVAVSAAEDHDAVGPIRHATLDVGPTSQHRARSIEKV